MGGRVLVMLLVFTAAGRAQELPEAPVSKAMVSKQTYTAFAVIGAEVVADGITTRVLYQRHYDETDPLARPFSRWRPWADWRESARTWGDRGDVAGASPVAS